MRIAVCFNCHRSSSIRIESSLYSYCNARGPSRGTALHSPSGVQSSFHYRVPWPELTRSVARQAWIMGCLQSRQALPRQTGRVTLLSRADIATTKCSGHICRHRYTSRVVCWPYETVQLRGLQSSLYTTSRFIRWVHYLIPLGHPWEQVH